MKRGRPKGIGIINSESFGPLGNLIRGARLKLRLPLSVVARQCQCSEQFISNIEHGRAPMPWAFIEPISKVLQLEMNQIQVANLAVRSDFYYLAGLTDAGRKIKKPKVLKDLAHSMALISTDPEFFKILELYQAASHSKRKAFATEADKVLR